jgi:hypothetical protein
MPLSLPEEFKAQIGYREADTFAHSVTCVQPYGVIETVLDWCRSQCIGDWRWQIIVSSGEDRPGKYVFYFDSERDCVAFSLQWC